MSIEHAILHPHLVAHQYWIMRDRLHREVMDRLQENLDDREGSEPRCPHTLLIVTASDRDRSDLDFTIEMPLREEAVKSVHITVREYNAFSSKLK